MDIWKQVAIDDLKRFNSLESAIISMKEEVVDINAQLSVAGYSMRGTPVQGGGSKIEDRYNDAIVRKDKLKQQIFFNERDYNRIKAAVEKLPEQKQKLLTYAYINRGPNYINTIMTVFCVERSHAYRLVEDALKSYVMVRYGS